MVSDGVIKARENFKESTKNSNNSNLGAISSSSRDIYLLQPLILRTKKHDVLQLLSPESNR